MPLLARVEIQKPINSVKPMYAAITAISIGCRLKDPNSSFVHAVPPGGRRCAEFLLAAKWAAVANVLCVPDHENIQYNRFHCKRSWCLMTRSFHHSRELPRRGALKKRNGS